MFFAAKIKDMENQLAAANTEREQLQQSHQLQLTEQATQHQAALEGVTLERDQAREEATTLRGTVINLEAEVKRLNASVEKKVIEKVAEAGVPAVERVDSSTELQADAGGAGRTKTTWARDFTAKP